MARHFALIFCLLPATAQAEPNIIIHMLDTHYVSPGAFSPDLKDQDSGIISIEVFKLTRIQVIQSWSDQMSIDIELAVTHEAGHSVMQWLVGLEAGGIAMEYDSENTVSGAAAKCPPPTFNSLSNIRKRLLVLFAGNALTRKKWPNSNNDTGDWDDTAVALHLFLKRTISWKPDKVEIRKFQDEEADQIVQSVKLICNQIINHELFIMATDQMVKKLLELEPDVHGAATFKSSEIVTICEESIGKDFQADNQWSGWMAGQ